MTKTYKLLKEMPKHNIGDLLYKPFDDAKYYEWVNNPNYHVDANIVENDKYFFEEMIVNWETGDNIYFLSMELEVLDEEFLPSRHSKLVQSGNCFKDIESAEWAKSQIKKILSGDDILILYKDDILPIFLALQSNEIEKAKELIQKYI